MAPMSRRGRAKPRREPPARRDTCPILGPPVAGSAHTTPPPVPPPSDQQRSEPLSSNISQSYPYTSETEAERAAAIAAILAKRKDLASKLASETSPLDATDRWWVWKCPTPGCPGLLHAAGYAHDLHAVYVVCDGTCAKTFLR
jgi:hypothetical protein